MAVVVPKAPEASGGEQREPRSAADKVVRVLEALAHGTEGIGVREVARSNALDKSAVSRLLGQLVRLDLAEKDPVTGRYHAGPRLFALGAALCGRDTLRQAAEPILRSMVDKFNETCYLTVREGELIFFREKIDCDRYVRYVIESTERVPIHAGAGGRAVLSGLPPDEVDDLLARLKLVRLTDQTLTDQDALRRQLAMDRQRGFAVSHGERSNEGSAVAAPYFDAHGACKGSVVFSCPKLRFETYDVAEVAEAVVDAAHRLSARLGGGLSTVGDRALPS